MKTIFDWLADITYKKTPIKDIPQGEWSKFNPFSINLWLSMPHKTENGLDVTLLGLASYIQPYIFTIKDPKLIYKLYLGYLPKKRYNFKYIKSGKHKKYNEDLKKYIAKYFDINKTQAIDYLHILFKDDEGVKEIKSILSKYAVTPRQMKTLMKYK